MATVTIVTWGFLFLSIVSVVFAASFFPQTFPGTKWCGPGHIAKNDSDLGEFQELDACCRDHDRCPRNIHAGETIYGVTNTGNFTWSDCECDYAFRDCLQEVDSRTADTVAGVYFNFLKNRPCMRFNDNGTAHFERKPKYKSPLSDLISSFVDAIFG